MATRGRWRMWLAWLAFMVATASSWTNNTDNAIGWLAIGGMWMALDSLTQGANR